MLDTGVFFSDQQLVDGLEEAAYHSDKEGQNFLKVVEQIRRQKKTANESEDRKNIDEADWNVVQAMHQAAFPMANGNPFQPNFRAMDPDSGVPSLQEQGKNNVIAGAAAAALAGGAYAAGGWGERLEVL